jgi:anti-anti-sigma regulatory factor
MIETYVRSETAVECRPLGRLDWIGAVYLREAVCGSLRRGLELTVDLEMTDFVDMDGLDAIMDAARSVHEVGGSAVIINAPLDLNDLLRIREILHHLDSEGARDPRLGASVTIRVSRDSPRSGSAEDASESKSDVCRAAEEPAHRTGSACALLDHRNLAGSRPFSERRSSQAHASSAGRRRAVP